MTARCDHDLSQPDVWETSYPVVLIRQVLEAKGPAFLCDEIRRDEDPTYVHHQLLTALLAFVGEERFCGRRLLDFGCGAGASSVVLARRFSQTEVVGVDIEAPLLALACARAAHHRLANVSFVCSPAPMRLPPNLGTFDFVVLSAVYEHLLPAERAALLPQLWHSLRPGGILFINQTPHRLFPVERHTTGLPFINYLPPRLALVLARRFSRRVSREESWISLLRRGVRGGTANTILRDLGPAARRCARLLKPYRLGVRDEVDLWYRLSRHGRFAHLRRCLWCFLKVTHLALGVVPVPCLSLAIHKSA